jgi:hypothetical protein
VIVGVIVGVITVLTACAPAPAAAPAPGPAAAAPSDGKVVVYSGRSEALTAPLMARFTAATGIAVEARYAGTAAMAGRRPNPARCARSAGARTSAPWWWCRRPGTTTGARSSRKNRFHPASAT